MKFTSKNYSAREFQFRLFVIGKELCGHIDETDSALTDPTDLIKWKIKDARVIT